MLAEALASRTTQAACTVLARHEGQQASLPPPGGAAAASQRLEVPSTSYAAAGAGQTATERNLLVDTLDLVGCGSA